MPRSLSAWTKPSQIAGYVQQVLTPMIPTLDPHQAAADFAACGWHIDFETAADSADRMAVVSLGDNTVLLGVAEPPFVDADALPHLGAGTAFNCTLPSLDLS